MADQSASAGFRRGQRRFFSTKKLTNDVLHLLSIFGENTVAENRARDLGRTVHGFFIVFDDGSSRTVRLEDTLELEL